MGGTVPSGLYKLQTDHIRSLDCYNNYIANVKMYFCIKCNILELLKEGKWGMGVERKWTNTQWISSQKVIHYQTQ